MKLADCFLLLRGRLRERVRESVCARACVRGRVLGRRVLGRRVKVHRRGVRESYLTEKQMPSPKTKEKPTQYMSADAFRKKFKIKEVKGDGLCFWRSVIVGQQHRRGGAQLPEETIKQEALRARHKAFQETCAGPNANEWKTTVPEEYKAACPFGAETAQKNPPILADHLLIQGYVNASRQPVEIYERRATYGDYSRKLISPMDRPTERPKVHVLYLGPTREHYVALLPQHPQEHKHQTEIRGTMTLRKLLKTLQRLHWSIDKMKQLRVKVVD